MLCESRGLKVETDLDWLLDVGGDDGVQWHPLAHLLDKALDSSPRGGDVLPGDCVLEPGHRGPLYPDPEGSDFGWVGRHRA